MAKLKTLIISSLALLIAAALPGEGRAEDADQTSPAAAASADAAFPPAASLMPRLATPRPSDGGLSVIDTVLMSMGLASGRVEHVEGRLAFVRAELGLSGEQEGRWQAFAEAVRQGARAHNARLATASKMEFTRPMVIERLDRLEQRLAAQLDDVRAIRNALTVLHASLTEAQRTALDRLVRMHVAM